MTAGNVYKRRLGSVYMVICPACGFKADCYHSLENGIWAHEPIENFGFDKVNNGMICAEWGNSQLVLYLHSDELLCTERERVEAAQCLRDSGYTLRKIANMTKRSATWVEDHTQPPAVN